MEISLLLSGNLLPPQLQEELLECKRAFIAETYTPDSIRDHRLLTLAEKMRGTYKWLETVDKRKGLHHDPSLVTAEDRLAYISRNPDLEVIVVAHYVEPSSGELHMSLVGFITGKKNPRHKGDIDAHSYYILPSLRAGNAILVNTVANMLVRGFCAQSQLMGFSQVNIPDLLVQSAASVKKALNASPYRFSIKRNSDIFGNYMEGRIDLPKLSKVQIKKPEDLFMQLDVRLLDKEVAQAAQKKVLTDFATVLGRFADVRRERERLRAIEHAEKRTPEGYAARHKRRKGGK